MCSELRDNFLSLLDFVRHLDLGEQILILQNFDGYRFELSGCCWKVHDATGNHGICVGVCRIILEIVHLTF